MAIDGSTSLNGSTIANLLTKLWLPGVNGAGGSGTCKELVGAASPTRTLGGSATTGSDGTGSYATVAHDSADYVDIAETLDPSGAGALILYWSPIDAAGGGSWQHIAGLCDGDASSGGMFSLARDGSGPDLSHVIGAGRAPFSNAENNLTDGAVTCNVITWTGSGATSKLYQNGQTVNASSFDPGAQRSGNSTGVRIGTTGGWGTYGSKMYAIGYIDGTVLNATDAQTVANDIVGTLFTAGGGGGSGGPFPHFMRGGMRGGMGTLGGGLQGKAAPQFYIPKHPKLWVPPAPMTEGSLHAH